jgi:hypothetical protein
VNRKELLRAYKETPRPAGIFRVRHNPSGRTLLGSSPDAPAMLNRVRAQLNMGGHPNRVLQRDWESDGPDAFLFEVVDLMPPGDASEEDARAELRVLEEMWREKLDARGASSY